MDAYAHANPTGPVEGDPEGPAERAVPAGHLPGTGHIPRDRAQVRLRREPPTKKLSAKERAKLMALRKSTAVAN